MDDPIRFFASIDASDINEVGGKGANLGELARAGFNVPEGFCVTTQSYSAFILPEQKRIFRWLENLDTENLDALRKTGNKVRQLLATLPLPKGLQKPLVEAWQKLGETNAYAVRSSATAEDLPQASFAGQQDTYLNIVGRQDLLNSVRDCFISLFTDRAILYRIQNNFDHQDVLLSVVVQKMIMPQASGIMFTADPVSGKRRLTSIDASFGIGEALVSGLVSPDLYQVDKSTDQICKKQIGDKKIAIRPIEGGGTETVNLSAEESARSTLDDARIISLTRLGTAIENHYGKPQDIEWALLNGEFFITQSRPITSLYPLPVEQNTPEKLYISLNHFQVMTDAMPPLSLTLFMSLLPIGRDERTMQTRYVKTAGGRMFAEISNILSHPLTGRVFPALVYRADHLVGKMVTQWQSENADPEEKTKIRLLKVIPVVAPFMRRVMACLFFRKYQRFPRQMSGYMDDYVEQVNAKLKTADSVAGQLEICAQSIRAMIHTVEPWRAHLIASMLALKLLNVVMKHRVASSALDALMRGLEGNVTTEMDLAVGDLADAARSSESLMQCLLGPRRDVETMLKQAKEHPGGENFGKQWDVFIKRYGARGPSEIDLYRPRWREDSSSLMTMIAGILKSGEAGAHRIHYQELIAENEKAAEEIIKAAGSGILGLVRKPLVRRLVYVIRQLFPLREHHKFLIIQLLDITKPVLERAGTKLQQKGIISDNDDVWFMQLHELQDLLDKDNFIGAQKIEQRKRDFEIYKKLTPPRVMTGDGEILRAEFDNAHAPAGSLVGSPVSAGVVEGVAKVVLDPSSQTLHPGEILVAPFTDPGWTPLFVNASGLVTEVGGLMTHGSVIAREYGIPAVVSVIGATTKIRTGQKIRVHGEAGYVEILDNKEGASQ